MPTIRLRRMKTKQHKGMRLFVQKRFLFDFFIIFYVFSQMQLKFVPFLNSLTLGTVQHYTWCHSVWHFTKYHAIEVDDDYEVDVLVQPMNVSTNKNKINQMTDLGLECRRSTCVVPNMLYVCVMPKKNMWKKNTLA